MKNENRTGFFPMFIILVLLGLVIYAYKDKFIKIFNTPDNNNIKFTKEKPKEKSNNKNESFLSKIFEIENKQKKDNQPKDSPVKKKISNIKKTLSEKKDVFQSIKPEEKITKTNEDNNTRKKEKESKKKLATVNEIKKEENQEKEIELTDNKQEITITNSIKNQESEQKNKTDNTRNSIVYFTRLNSSNQIELVQRQIDVSFYNKPLTMTLNKLLEGPNNIDKSNNLISSVPENTRLISAWVKDDVAYLNFSRDFEYNPFGKESSILQLKQIVYTATEFNNIKAVQFLIEGNKKEYLGGEGIFINKPISRDDFS